jgi:hypothetical protein
MSASQLSTIAAEYGWPGGDCPGELSFHLPASEQARNALLPCIREALPNVPQDAPLLALTPPSGIVSRYKLVLPGESLFVRVSIKLVHPLLEQKITGWLKQKQVRVNHVEVAGLITWHEGRPYRIDLRQMLNARHFDGSLDDLRQVALTLSACHEALVDFPDETEVRRNTASRFIRLSEAGNRIRSALVSGRWRFICQDPAWASKHYSWLARMMREWNPRLDLLPSAQCLHAQMHQGNVLYDLENGRAILVDLEEAVQNLAPTSWDMAYLVQRFCLTDEPSEATLRQRLQIVREAYGRAVPDLVSMMQQTSWLSMAVLVDYLSKGIVSPLSEYDKFVRLETQAREHAAILEEYFSE